jgi:hypothetical protein
MAKFLLLARGPGSTPDMSPEQMQKLIQRYMAWSKTLGNKLVDSNKLNDDGRVLTRRTGKLVVTDGPHAETKEVVGGYWLFEAADYAAAEKLIADHPHLERGLLELRQLFDYR